MASRCEACTGLPVGSIARGDARHSGNKSPLRASCSCRASSLSDRPEAYPTFPRSELVFLPISKTTTKRKPAMQDTAFGLLAGGAALGLLASMWGKIKGVAWRHARPARSARRDPHRGRARGAHRVPHRQLQAVAELRQHVRRELGIPARRPLRPHPLRESSATARSSSGTAGSRSSSRTRSRTRPPAARATATPPAAG